MKLSDAIMLNGMMKPQGRGAASMRNVDAPCALGGALQVMGRQSEAYAALAQIWPWTLQDMLLCPAADDSALCEHRRDDASIIIYHLNDWHMWTREQIAAWVATVEPQDTDHEFTDGGQVTRHGKSSETCLVDEKVISDAL